MPGDGLRVRRAVLHPRLSQVSGASLPRDVAGRTQRPVGRHPGIPDQRAPAHEQLRAWILRLYCLCRDHRLDMCDATCHIFRENNHQMFTDVVACVIGGAIQVLMYSSVQVIARYSGTVGVSANTRDVLTRLSQTMRSFSISAALHALRV